MFHICSSNVGKSPITDSAPQQRSESDGGRIRAAALDGGGARGVSARARGAWRCAAGMSREWREHQRRLWRARAGSRFRQAVGRGGGARPDRAEGADPGGGGEGAAARRAVRRLSSALRWLDRAAHALLPPRARRDGMRARRLCPGADFRQFGLSDAAARRGVRAGLGKGARRGRADARTGGLGARGRGLGRSGLEGRRRGLAQAAFLGRAAQVPARSARGLGAGGAGAECQPEGAGRLCPGGGPRIPMPRSCGSSR